MPEPGPDMVAMPVVEAAARLGLTTEAVRTRIRRGMLESRRGNNGRRVVLVPRSQLGSDATEQGSGSDQTTNGLAVLLESELARLVSERDQARSDAETWRAKAEERSKEAAELRGALGRAEAKAEAITAVAKGEVEAAKRVAAAEVEAMREQLQAGIAARNAVIEELRAMLAAARRPWWRRLFG